MKSLTYLVLPLFFIVVQNDTLLAAFSTIGLVGGTIWLAMLMINKKEDEGENLGSEPKE